MNPRVTVNGIEIRPSAVTVVLQPNASRAAEVMAENLVREVTGRDPASWTDGTGATTIAASKAPAYPELARGDMGTEDQAKAAVAEWAGAALKRASYTTRAAAGQLQSLLDVDERTARAMLTIAASDIGEYVINGIRVRRDDDAQEFLIEPFQ